MFKLISFCLAAFGLTGVLIEGKPTAPFRWLVRKLLGEEWGGYLVRCYQCLGFWVGAALAYLWWRGDPVMLCAAPFISSGVCWLLGSWVKAQIPIQIGGDSDVEGNSQ